ncbi:MAG: beta-mannosidase, partial [Bacteroidales bacterium]|nr:beta-mannosidase [Bacteroidales bacterium]
MKSVLKPILLAGLALVLVSCGNAGRAGRIRLLNCLEASVDAGKILYGHQDDLCYGHSWKVEDPANDPLERSDVKDVCGQYPAVLGLELGEIELGGAASLDG